MKIFIFFAFLCIDAVVQCTTTKISPDINQQLRNAAVDEAAETVRQLLKSGADVNTRYEHWEENKTVLHFAARHGRTNIVSLLLANSAEVDARDERNYAPIHSAAMFGHADIVTDLLVHNASVESRGGLLNQTPLHIASEYNQSRVVSVLLNNSANIDAADNNGWTPLHYASRWNCTNVVLVLLDNGANVFAKAKHSYDPEDLEPYVTPLDLAKSNDKASKEIVDILEKKQQELIA